MFCTITIEEIKEGLKHNLEMINSLKFKPTDYNTFLQACPLFESSFKDNYREMEQFYWKVGNLCDIIDANNNNTHDGKQLLEIEIEIVKEMRTGVEAFDAWQNEELTFMQHFCYEKGAKAEEKEKRSFIDNYLVIEKEKIDTQRERWIKDILAYEWQLDAQIALQHTIEFSQTFENLNEQKYDNARQFFIGGYHAGGIISGNIMRQLKHFYKIDFNGYIQLKEVCAH